MAEPTFGFAVRRKVRQMPWNRGSGVPRPEPVVWWEVFLPHQCDAWEVSGEPWFYGGPGASEDPHGFAVKNLEAFIAEAQEALVALREGLEFGEDD